MSARLAALVLPLSLIACSELPDASPEPMGEPVPLGSACDPTPVATGLGPGDIAPNIVGTDQYGRELNLHEHFCDRHVVILRAGFD
jgi:hypothetical protein